MTDDRAPATELAHELALFRTSVRRFFEREVVPHCDDWRRAGEIDSALWRKAGAAGLLCASMPQDYGGAGGDFRHEAIIIEELGRIGFYDFSIQLHNAIVAPYYSRYGTQEQRRRWLPRLATGELIAAIAMTEPSAGSDLKALRTTARRDGDSYVIRGQKTFITNGSIANLICVAAKLEPAADGKGISLFIVETEKAEGLRRGRNLDKIGLKAQGTSELFFDDVRVPAENLLGLQPGDGFAQMMEQLPQERLVIAVQAVAAMEAAMATTVAYVKERQAFGGNLLDLQNTRFVLAEAKSEATIARVFVDHCIERLLVGELDSTTAAMAKWWTTQKQCEIIDACLQLHGGYGYMNEYPIARMWADARVQKIYAGANELMKELIARSL